MKSESPDKIQVIDLIRGIAVLQVLADHFFKVAVPDLVLAPPVHFSDPLYQGILNWCHGTYGVTMFFVVSGFLITRLIATQREGLFHPNLGNFYARRAGRILPLITLCLLVGILVRALANDDTGPRLMDTFGNSELHLGPAFWLSIAFFQFNWYRVLMQHVEGFRALHWGVLWSLSIEEQFYLFYPLILGWLGKARRLLMFLAGVVLVGFLYRALMVHNPPAVIFGSFSNFDAIALGALLFVAAEKFGNRLRKEFSLSLLLCLSGAALLAAADVFTDPEHDPLTGSISIALGTFLLLLGGLHLDFFNRAFLKWAAFPGRLSYGCYLLHSSVFFFFWPLLGGKPLWVSFGLFLAAVLATAWVSHRFFEMPANRWIRAKLQTVG